MARAPQYSPPPAPPPPAPIAAPAPAPAPTLDDEASELGAGIREPVPMYSPSVLAEIEAGRVANAKFKLRHQAEVELGRKLVADHAARVAQQANSQE